jgi:energy-coupling factor transporter ATP-binding protein EcfA2
MTNEPFTSTTKSSETPLPEIQLNDRVAIFGGTGTGKSILAQVLFRSLPAKWWKVIVDVTDSIEEPSALKFYDPENIPWGDAYNLQYIPDIDYDLEEQINTLYLNIFFHGVCWVWLDEANEVTTAHHTAFGLRKILLQGRKAYVGHVACTPRPADISKSIVTQAQYVITFNLVDFEDRLRMARYIGMTLDEFDEQMRQLNDYEYLLYDVRMQTLYIAPPIPQEIVADILNPPRKPIEPLKPERADGID